jgi:hypothetical protein
MADFTPAKDELQATEAVWLGADSRPPEHGLANFQLCILDWHGLNPFCTRHTAESILIEQRAISAVYMQTLFASDWPQLLYKFL